MDSNHLAGVGDGLAQRFGDASNSLSERIAGAGRGFIECRAGMVVCENQRCIGCTGTRCRAPQGIVPTQDDRLHRALCRVRPGDVSLWKPFETVNT
jgi:hypothetical protein